MPGFFICRFARPPASGKASPPAARAAGGAYVLLLFFPEGGTHPAGAGVGVAVTPAASRMAWLSAMVWFSASSAAWASSRCAMRSALPLSASSAAWASSSAAWASSSWAVASATACCASVIFCCASNSAWGRSGGFVADAALQQGGLLGQGLLGAVRAGQAQGLAVIAAPQRDKALARADHQRLAVGGGQLQGAGGVLLGPGDGLPRAAGQVKPRAAGHIIVAGVAVVLDAAGRIEHEHVGEGRLLAVVGVGGRGSRRRWSCNTARWPRQSSAARCRRG